MATDIEDAWEFLELNLFRDVGLEAFAQDIGGIIQNGVIPSMVDGA